jgi:competence protein ComEA
LARRGAAKQIRGGEKMRVHLWVVLLSLGFGLLGDAAVAKGGARAGRGESADRVASSKRDEAGPAASQPKLDLNSATVEELSTLPGIGPKRARAIVAYRERHRFARTRELRRIRGIGPKTFVRLQAHVTIGGPARGLVSATPGTQPRATLKR